MRKLIKCLCEFVSHVRVSFSSQSWLVTCYYLIYFYANNLKLSIKQRCLKSLPLHLVLINVLQQTIRVLWSLGAGDTKHTRTCTHTHTHSTDQTGYVWGVHIIVEFFQGIKCRHMMFKIIVIQFKARGSETWKWNRNLRAWQYWL